jgi:nucleotide-binding universal stress UspA family protein
MLAVRTILHPTDFSERSSCAFELAHALARDYGARLIVLHVALPPRALYNHMPLEASKQEEYQRSLEDKLRWMRAPESPVPVEPVLKEGDAATKILETAAEKCCDLIVMGTHGRSGLGRLLLGSVAEEVVRSAACPVLTVKTPFPAEAPEPAAPAREEATAAPV